jgi:hypothetical protein
LAGVAVFVGSAEVVGGGPSLDEIMLDCEPGAAFAVVVAPPPAPPTSLATAPATASATRSPLTFRSPSPARLFPAVAFAGVVVVAAFVVAAAPPPAPLTGDAVFLSISPHSAMVFAPGAEELVYTFFPSYPYSFLSVSLVNVPSFVGVAVVPSCFAVVAPVPDVVAVAEPVAAVEAAVAPDFCEVAANWLPDFPAGLPDNSVDEVPVFAAAALSNPVFCPVPVVLTASPLVLVTALLSFRRSGSAGLEPADATGVSGLLAPVVAGLAIAAGERGAGFSEGPAGWAVMPLEDVEVFCPTGISVLVVPLGPTGWATLVPVVGFGKGDTFGWAAAIGTSGLTKGALATGWEAGAALTTAAGGGEAGAFVTGGR